MTDPEKNYSDEYLGNGMWRISGEQEDFIYWSDPEWEGALKALETDRNPKPLSALLQRADPIPQEVAKHIGRLLDPPWGTKGPRLIFKVSINSDHRKLIATVLKKSKFHVELQEAVGEAGKLEAAIAVMQARYGITSRSFWMECHAMDDLETTRQIESILTGVEQPKLEVPVNKEESA